MTHRRTHGTRERASSRVPEALALLLSAWLASGCALINSSTSISDSISKSSTSASDSFSASSDSSKSSSDGDEAEVESAYRRDVRDLAAAWAGAAAPPERLVRDLGRVAESHGISDWQRELGTYRALGAGLRRGGLDSRELQRLELRLDAGVPEARTALREGYGS